MKQADLHIHTHFSDSTSSPQEVVEQAHTCGLECISITDHDTVEGIHPTREAASACNIEVIPGIEFSSEFNGKDIHILGYCIDYENPQFLDQINLIQDSRIQRMKEMIHKLSELGVKDIELEEVCALAKSKSVGRPHLATILVQKGKVPSIKRAFDRYLAEGGPAFVSKFKQSPQEAINLIKKLGGVSVLAHPMATSVDELIPSFVQAGLQGLEVYYPNSSQNIVDFYAGIASKHNLVMTGGSDAHGAAKKNTFVGKMKIPYILVEKLKELSSTYSS